MELTRADHQGHEGAFRPKGALEYLPVTLQLGVASPFQKPGTETLESFAPSLPHRPAVAGVSVQPQSS